MNQGTRGKPVVLFNDTRVDRHHGCHRVIRTIFEQLTSRGFEIVATAHAHKDWRQDASVLQALERCSLIIVNGEGTIHHNSPVGMQLLEVGAIARSLGVPAAIINMTWYKNDEQFASLLNDFAVVSVRESRSQLELIKSGIKARSVPDLSLLDHIPTSEFRQGVGVTDSVVPEVTARLERVRKEFDARELSLFNLGGSLQDYLRTLKISAWGRKARGDSSYLGVLLDAIRLSKCMTKNESEITSQISQLSLLITGRFHGVCLALSAETPFLAVESNTHKIRSLISDAGVGEWRSVPPGAFDSALLERAQRWEPHEHECLKFFLQDARTRISALFDELRALT